MKYLMAFVVVVWGALAQAETTIYVAPNGDDRNSGLNDAEPLRTFQAAADAARGGATVLFAGGVYVFDQSVVLDARYSGITFRAAAGETPVFTSLLRVTDWMPYEGEIMRAPSPLPAGTHVRYLQDASEDWMTRSQTQVFRAVETTQNPENSYHDPDVQLNKLNVQHPNEFGVGIDWSKAAQYDLRASQSGWNQEILSIASYDLEARRIYTSIPANYEMRAHESEASWPNENWVMNTVAGIDEPGEWAIIDDMIYLWPRSGVADIYVPQLGELIRVDGGGDGNTWSGTPVNGITFDGITFTGADFYMLQDGDIATTHDWDVVDRPTALLRFRNAENGTVMNCTFVKSGGAALRLDRYAQGFLIEGNIIDHMGRGGISLIGRGPGYGDVNTGNDILGNVITSIGREKWTSLAINLDQSSNNLMAHNYIEDTYFTAIAITAPKQFIFMSHVWDIFEGDTWQGRDFHAREFKPSVYEDIREDPIYLFDLGTWAAMEHIYSGYNVIEQNALVNTASGQGYLTQSVIYISGIPRHQTTFVRYNYFTETVEARTNSNMIWADSDQDNTDWIGNMVYGIDLADDAPEPAVVFRANTLMQGAQGNVLHDREDRALLSANVTLASKYSANIGYDIKDYIERDGNVTDVNEAVLEHLSQYYIMWRSLCGGNHAGQGVAGARMFQAELAGMIVALGGDFPTCR